MSERNNIELSNINSVTIFLPMYNEEQTIESTLGKIVNEVEKVTHDYEIIIINDGSKDDSYNKVKNFMKYNTKVRIINNPGNQGYGFSLRAGFCNAEKDVIFYTDCDLPIRFESIQEAFNYMEDYDLVVGYRLNRNETFRRKVYSLVYNFLIRRLFNVTVRDVNFSFKMIRRTVLNNIKLTAKTVFIDGQLLAEATRNGISIKEIPIEYIPRIYGKSNFDKVSYAMKTFVEIIVYFFLKLRDNER